MNDEIRTTEIRTAEIRTARLVLRRWRDADRTPFAALNADPEVMRHFPAPLTRQQSDALVDRFEAQFDEHGYGAWAVDADGTLIGFTGLLWATWPSTFTPALEVGWRLARPAWGAGYASEAATAALTRGWQYVDSIISLTATTNRRSERVMQRIGMRYVQQFDHPKLAAGHPLRRHVLYRADRPVPRGQ
ncbi:MAG TPA: GNAT family N-acetyltransferase [Mycobacteriales bacterium]|nr:GNAT family N-acetyltransferase [Mycobacteriales bacterium]